MEEARRESPLYVNRGGRVMHLCYEIMKHETDKPDYMDQCISSDICLTKEEAIRIVNELNRQVRDIPVKYYWRVRV